MQHLTLYFILFTFNFILLHAQSIEELGIKVTTQDRQYVFTNKEAGTYHGEVNAHNSGGWQGWFVNAENFFHDYTITIKNKMLDRTTAASVVYPHQLIRTYSDGTKETVTLLDSINVLLIEVNSPFAQIEIQPTDNFILDSSSSLVHHWKRTNAAQRVESSTAEFIPSDIIVVRRLKRNVITFAIAAGKNVEHLKALANETALLPKKFVAQRKERMQKILDRSQLKTGNSNLETAIAWAKLQLDALIMNQSTGRRLPTGLLIDSLSGARTKGIFAGLPWFNNYWGRDSFISLPGATYVIGNFSDARDVLLSYAAFQEFDSTNSNYGRIPNLATPQSVIYNTADGTPWFVKSLYEYVKYSGDTALVRELYPVIVRSIEGTIKFHSDTLGFLTHGEAESWMDAVGPNGPWSPRGNRACDVQALWHQQLMIGVFCAEYFNDFHNAARWKNIADKLEINFRKYFVDTTSNLIYDHLNTDGSPSTELRPNQLFAFDMAIPEDVRQNVVRTVLKELVYEHGTATLAQSDSNFHPFHEYPPYYVKDAAYHNGIVWTWLNGAAIYAATRYDLQDVVFPVTKNSVHQILHRGTVGALSELLDAHSRPQVIASANKIGDRNDSLFSEPKLSGTYSQAWSLAEFIRSIYQDYLGVSVDVPSKIIRIQPKLPKEINSIEFEQRVGNGSLTISYQRTNEKIKITVAPKNLTEKFSVNYLWVYENGDAVLAPVDLLPDQPLTIEHTLSTLKVFRGTKKIIEEKNNPKIFLRNFSDKKYFINISLAHPELHRKFPALRGPSHPLLTNKQVRTINSSALLLFDQSDVVGDDVGSTGTYQYAGSRHFKKGILDITNAEFRYDEKNLYCKLSFANLYNPGWHPEYGFQLTLAAIAINTGNGTQRNVDINSNYILDSARAFDKLILVGGGVRILDATEKILCEYIPKQEDVNNPIGNIKEKCVGFSVPLEYIGMPNKHWKITILVGAQDDHGGAGIGEFRSIEKEASEWLGGGKINSSDSNVYDVLIIN